MKSNLEILLEQLPKGLKKVDNKALLKNDEKVTALILRDIEFYINEGYDIPMYPYITHRKIPLTDELIQAFDYMGIAITGLTVCGLKVFPFVSYKHEECQGMVTVPIEHIMTYLNSVLENGGELDFVISTTLTTLVNGNNSLYKLFNEKKDLKEYFNMVLMLDKRQAMGKFFELLPLLEERNISTDDICSLFLETYYMSDYNFEQISWDLMDTHLEKQSSNSEYSPIHIDKKYIDEDGYITIYRSASSLSMNLEEARSWTLSKDVALRLAKRYVRDSDKYLYEAKVLLEDIKAYIQNRSEKEVLVDYYDIENIKGTKLN